MSAPRDSRTSVRRVLVLGLWMLLALVGVVLVLGVFATRGSVDYSDLPRIQTTDDARRRALTKLGAFAQLAAQAQASGRDVPTQLVLTQDELSVLVRDWGEQEHWFGTMTDAQVVFRPGVLTVTGAIQAFELVFPFRIDVAVTTTNRERQAEILRVQLGELYAPEFLRSLVLALVERTVDAGLPRVPMAIETMVVTEGELLISGAAIP